MKYCLNFWFELDDVMCLQLIMTEKGFALFIPLLTVAAVFLSVISFYYGRQSLNIRLDNSINPTEEELLLNPQTDEPDDGENVLGTATLPGPGYHRIKVRAVNRNFTVSIGAADLNSTKVIVDTASPSDCADNCPVLSLKDYAMRNGAYAAINGSYFCPSTYPSCSGKKNSFDTLVLNKDKVYFNSANNIYSTVPAVIFQGNSARFVAQSLEWGRDTSPDAVIANYPLMIFNGQQFFYGSGDGKLNGRGGRSFIATKGNMVYIGVVHNASVLDATKVLMEFGVDNALNLDSGGSTALFWGAYKIGPGRNIPNAILFKQK